MTEIRCAAEECQSEADHVDLYCGRHIWYLIGEFILTVIVILSAAKIIHYLVMLAWQWRFM